MPAQRHRDASFVVRFWWERRVGVDALWRGQVVHARTGQARYFDRLEDLLEFIEQWTGGLRPEDAEQAPIFLPGPHD